MRDYSFQRHRSDTHNFRRHSIARSILNSGRLMKPSAFSSCRHSQTEGVRYMKTTFLTVWYQFTETVVQVQQNVFHFPTHYFIIVSVSVDYLWSTEVNKS